MQMSILSPCFIIIIIIDIRFLPVLRIAPPPLIFDVAICPQSAVFLYVVQPAISSYGFFFLHVIPLILIQGTACPFGPIFISSHAAIFEIKMGLNVMQSSFFHGRWLAGRVPIQCITPSKDYPLPI